MFKDLSIIVLPLADAPFVQFPKIAFGGTHSFENILNLDQWFRRRCHLKNLCLQMNHEA